EQLDHVRSYLLRQANAFTRSSAVEPGVREQRQVRKQQQKENGAHTECRLQPVGLIVDCASTSIPSSTRLSTSSNGPLRCGAISLAAPPAIKHFTSAPSCCIRIRICS